MSESWSLWSLSVDLLSGVITWIVSFIWFRGSYLLLVSFRGSNLLSGPNLLSGIVLVRGIFCRLWSGVICWKFTLLVSFWWSHFCGYYGQSGKHSGGKVVLPYLGLSGLDSGFISASIWIQLFCSGLLFWT